MEIDVDLDHEEIKCMWYDIAEAAMGMKPGDELIMKMTKPEPNERLEVLIGLMGSLLPVGVIGRIIPFEAQSND